MPINNRIADFSGEMTSWRRHIHKYPETAFEEHKTSDFIASGFMSLASRFIVGWRVPDSRYAEGKRGKGPAIGLRADMDALDIEEAKKLIISPKTLERCMPADMMGTQRCCWRRQIPIRNSKFCGHGPFHLPTGRRERGWRPGDD